MTKYFYVFVFLIFYFWFFILKKYYNLNNRIRAPKLRVIDENGKNLDILTTAEALDLAREKELDLVEITNKTNPPVAKIMNFGQFLYEQKKKEQKAKTKTKKTGTKGIRLSLRISRHDKELRVNQAKKFLGQGNKIKIEMKLVGRERQHLDLARNIINEFIENLNENVVLDQPLIQQGGRLNVLVRKRWLFGCSSVLLLHCQIVKLFNALSRIFTICVIREQISVN